MTSPAGHSGIAPSTRRASVCVALAVLIVASFEVRPAERSNGDVLRYEGYAYGADGTNLLYRETHWLHRDDGVPARLVLYRCPDGRAFARKTLREVDGASRPYFEFTDGRDGHREGVRPTPRGREVYWQERSGTPLRTQLLHPGLDVVIDAGFDAFIRSHGDSLWAGAPLNAHLLLPSRFAAVDVRIEDGTTAADRAAHLRRMKVRLDAWYAFALPTMWLVYDEDRRLREFRGIGTIRDDHGRNREVVIRFPRDQRVAEADDAALVAAARTELVGRCAP